MSFLGQVVVAFAILVVAIVVCAYFILEFTEDSKA